MLVQPPTHWGIQHSKSTADLEQFFDYLLSNPVHNPVHIPVHTPVRSPESRFFYLPYQTIPSGGPSSITLLCCAEVEGFTEAEVLVAVEGEPVACTVEVTVS